MYLVGSLGLLALVGCARWIEQREPWRREAEVACLQSGAVKENPSLVKIAPIDGPGVCGAAFPFKVSELGRNSALGYTDDLRPPGGIPRGGTIPSYPPQGPVSQPYPARAPVSQPYPAEQYPYDSRPVERQPMQAGRPIPIAPPGTANSHGISNESEPHEAEEPDTGAPDGANGDVPALGPQRYAPMRSSAPIGVAPTATLACPLVASLDRWVAETIQPSAQRWFGQPVVEIKQISAYSCRGMNGNPRSRISEHAFGNALDIAAFVLADGRRVTVKNGWRGQADERGFLRDVHAGACQLFSTVLAPGSNIFHYDHIHVDLMRRGSGRRICNPAAVPGEMVAGSHRPLGYADEHDPTATFGVGLPKAVPGED